MGTRERQTREKSSSTMRIDLPSPTAAVPPKPPRQTRAVRTPLVGRGRGADSDYAKLLQGIYDGVLVADTDGRVLDLNARAATLLRCQEQELRGAQVLDVVAGADARLWDTVRRNADDGRYTVIEARCLRGDKSSFPAEIAVNRVELDARAHLCFFIRDISVRKQAQEALQAAVSRLEAHDKAQWQFVSNVSHELRTPLTSMLYAVSNLLRGVVGPVPDGVRRYLEMLDGDCRRLLGTVNDILDLRKIDHQTLTLVRIRTPLARRVRRSVESLAVRAQQKSVVLEVQPPASPLFVNGDPSKLERVVLNIVGNAVKFTPDGGRIEVVLREDPARGGWAQIVVQDNGIGIPADAIGHVTERYFTVGDQPSGSGLGLALAKEIVALHGGSIDIQSPPPNATNGTRVTVSLPRSEPPSLLVAEDDPAVAGVLVHQLTVEGYRVISCDSGSEACERILRDVPDGVVLDLVLPGMEGTELVLKVRSSPATRLTPVVALSGVALGVARQQILRSFAIPLLTKPWQEDELFQRLEDGFMSMAMAVRQEAGNERKEQGRDNG